MNYRELFKRYKQGLLNDEEKQWIEQEIEKFEALEGYLSEVLDEEIDDVVNASGFEAQKEETQQLKKSVNTRLRKVVFISVLIVVLLYIGVFYGVSGIIDQIYYDPTAVTQSEKQAYNLKDFYYDIQAYVSLNMPGYASNSFTFQESKGFGEYEVSYSIRNLLTENEQRSFVNLSRGKLSYAVDGIFSTENRFGIWEGFERIQRYFPEGSGEDTTIMRDEDIQRKTEKTFRYLKELNPLSYISMSIVFDGDLTMEEFYRLSQEHPSLDFKWVGVRTVEPGTKWSETQPMHLIGFNPNLSDEASSNRRPDPEEYPLFYLVDMHDYSDLSKKSFPEAMAKAYGIHFKSRVEYLKNRKDFVNLFDYNSFKTDFYTDALVYIDNHGVKTYGVLVFGTAEDFLDRIDEIPYDSLYINEVLPIKSNIYYD